MFNRKHYVAIANILSDNIQRVMGDVSATAALYRVADDMATLFTVDNSAFDRMRFERAINVPAAPSPTEQPPADGNGYL